MNPTIAATLRRILQPTGFDIVNRSRVGINLYRDLDRVLGCGKVHVAFDVGANVGETTLSFLNAFPLATIHAFEPYAKPLEELKSKTARNPRVHAHACALGEREGTAVLHLNAADFTNSLLENDPGLATNTRKHWAEPLGTIEVPITTIDQFCANQSIGAIDLLKIDSQGYEMKILEGAERLLSIGAIRAIYLEISFVNLYHGQPDFASLSEYLGRQGFKFVDFYDQFRDENLAIKWCDALFVHA